MITEREKTFNDFFLTSNGWLDPRCSPVFEQVHTFQRAKFMMSRFNGLSVPIALHVLYLVFS